MTFKLFILLEKFLMLLPKSIRKAFFSFLSWFAYHISSRYRNIAYKNLDFAFEGKMSEKEKDDITRYSFKNLLFNFMYLMEVRYMSQDELRAKCSAINIDVVKKANDENRAIIYVTPHYGAWELAGIYGALLDKPTTAVYKKLKNQEYQEWLLESRGVFGNKSLEKSNVLKPLIKLMRSKESCVLVIDSSMNQREGLDVEFMSKTTKQTATPAYLARKFDACIIPVAIRTDDEENYTLTFYDEIKVDKTQDEQADILKATQAQADWLTKLITDEPKFWFWVHRRWKYEFPEVYKK